MEKVDIIVQACEDKKGVDIKVLDIKEMTSVSDYFVIVSGNSTTQVKAIADEIDEKMEKEGYERLNREGYRSSRWILLDYADVIVHIFHKEEREFYNIERLWTEEKANEGTDEDEIK